MSRDPAKLKVFAMADDLVERVHRARYGDLLRAMEKLIAALVQRT